MNTAAYYDFICKMNKSPQKRSSFDILFILHKIHIYPSLIMQNIPCLTTGDVFVIFDQTGFVAFM